jgi:glycosyltransferase involved in cell wall biosynthesis
MAESVGRSRITANQHPEEKNALQIKLRRVLAILPAIGLETRPGKTPQGISVIVRVKDEIDWVIPSIDSIAGVADEIVIADNGSADGTYESLLDLQVRHGKKIRLFRKPDLNHCELSNFLLDNAGYRWILRWDADMVAHTTGPYAIETLRDRILRLTPKRYFLIYLRHINLAGDLFHQDPREMVHIEEYIHTGSPRARFVHPGRFEAVRFPKYYQPLFWYEPYGFHVNVKPARKMLLRYFWEEWMALKDYRRFPTLESFVDARIEAEFGVRSFNAAQEICVRSVCRNYIRYDPLRFSPYPELLRPHLNRSRYRIKYQNGRIVGREVR